MLLRRYVFVALVAAVVLSGAGAGAGRASAGGCDHWRPFAAWMKWRDSGGPRPAAVPRAVPKACWARRAKIVAARTKPAPVSPWKLPIAFTAWGFKTGQFTAESLAAQLETAGVRSVAIQIGEAQPSVAAVFRRHGLAVYLWGVARLGDQAALDAFKADGWIPQVENDKEYGALMKVLAAGVGAGMPRALVTNFEGASETREHVLLPARMAALGGAGFTTAFVECYLQDDPVHRDLKRMTWQAKQLGWRDAVPVLGVFQGARFGDYDLTGFGRSFGFYSVEALNPDDWPAIAAQSR